MSNEFGDDPSIYVYPKDHTDGEAFPPDFWTRLSVVLENAGISWERT